MDEDKVCVAGAKFLEASLDRCICLLLSGVIDPNLRNHKELLARNSALCNCCSDAFLILIEFGGVYKAISCLDGFADAFFALIRTDLVETVSQKRHLNAVV